MKLTFVKHTKDERESEVKDWNGTTNGHLYRTIETTDRTYYTSCYISDTSLDTLNADDKYILSLLNRKAKEMNGNGIVEYIKAVNLTTIVKQLKDFKPYIVDEHSYKTEQSTLNGMPCHLNINHKTYASNSVSIAYKSNGKYEIISLNHTLTSEEYLSEWHKRSEKDKFYTYDFYNLEKNIWKTLYRLKAKGYVNERYVKGYVSTNRRGRYKGVKAKRFYTITEKGIEYLKSI